MADPNAASGAAIKSAAGQDASAPKSRNTVWVECSLPNGITLHRSREGKGPQGETIKVPIPETAVKLNGANSARVIGGYGLTEVDRDFWEEWIAEHKDFAPVVSRAIKAQPTRDRAMSQAMDEKGMPMGFERINPDKPGPGLTRFEQKSDKLDAP